MKISINSSSFDQISWGEGIYASKEVQLTPGESKFTVELDIPSKLVVDSTGLFYCYIYITLPSEQWSPECGGLTTELDIILPADIFLEGIDLMMSHLARAADFNDCGLCAMKT
ncbi:hypothetical protein MCGE09_00290, partial [Thaumarchaeota archaeon SCGC AB-539-E09]